MRRWARNMLVAGAVAAFVIPVADRVKNGIPVEAAAVADFNNNGTEDVAYWSYLDELKVLKFADGNRAKKSGSEYRVPFSDYNLNPRMTDAYRREHSVVSFDMNMDGNTDLIVRDPNLAQDPMIYANSGEIYLGDGKGNFRLSLSAR
ncbi:MAG: hypothetical protein WC613_01735 [Candidatus Aenigmatarchaeota archaeon]